MLRLNNSKNQPMPFNKEYFMIKADSMTLMKAERKEFHVDVAKLLYVAKCNSNKFPLYLS